MVALQMKVHDEVKIGIAWRTSFRGNRAVGKFIARVVAINNKEVDILILKCESVVPSNSKIDEPLTIDDVKKDIEAFKINLITVHINVVKNNTSVIYARNPIEKTNNV